LAQIDQTALAYAAGFIDGEGCFGIAKNGSVSISIVNCSIPSLERVREALGRGRITSRKQRVNRSQYLFRVYGDDAIYCIQLLLPYLIEKKPQALTILEYREEAKTYRIPGRRGRFGTNVKEKYREILKEQKRSEYHSLDSRPDCNEAHLQQSA